MDFHDKVKWKARARLALAGYFQKHSFPRLALSLVLIVTGGVGFLVSVLLLKLGMDQMWVRYPAALFVAYGGFLMMIRTWVEIERLRFDPQVEEIQVALENSEPDSELHPLPRKDRSWLDWIDLPDVNFLELEEGCLVVLVIGALAGVIGVLSVIVMNAEALVAEVFLDAFLISTLYRRLRIAAKEHWLGTAIRKTWVSVLMTAIFLAILGWGLEAVAPGSRSVGPAVSRLFRGGER